MATSDKKLNEQLKKPYMDKFKECFKDEEILVTGSQEFALPCVDAEGNEKFLVITFKVPNGTRDGEAYDGYSMAEDYALKLKQKQEKAEKDKAKKEAKIQKDKAKREKAKEEKGD